MAEPTLFLFAGGGTGGHLFPGLAIAERLRERMPESRAFFLCSERPLDEAILAKANVPFAAIPARPFSARPRALLAFLRDWSGAIAASREAIDAARREGAHVEVVTLGGFVAAPVAYAARRAGVPITMVNLDAVPGRANRLIAGGASRRFTVQGAKAPMTWTQTPPIVRAAAVPKGPVESARQRLGLKRTAPTLLVTGGSQGARSLNEFMRRLLEIRPEMFTGWQVLHQCGDGAENELRAAYDEAHVHAVVTAFCDSMGDAWAAADCAVARAGAGAVAEVWASNTPTLFLPYPHHGDDHQRFNAEPLVRAGGARLCRDLIDPGANAREAGPVLADLMSDEAGRRRMRDALQALGPADGADRIARALALADHAPVGSVTRPARPGAA